MGWHQQWPSSGLLAHTASKASGNHKTKTIFPVNINYETKEGTNKCGTEVNINYELFIRKKERRLLSRWPRRSS